ncbi:unnamed protein product [Ambrosiozyma monospora]|uniref:Unnamed protein product n=1 Tax=Ambrosiozyma monospora TaxID=43982 RepID=A0ACB5T0J3_AMBMO|nr:unnamed protein product [Ambrosiozyma monospora]
MLFKLLVTIFVGFQQLTTADSTTTLNSKEQLAMAVESNTAEVNLFISDLNANYASYTSYMDSNNMQFPEDLVQFVYDLNQFTDAIQQNSYFVESFPITEFYTYFTAFPWYSSLLSEAGASTFYMPDDFSTVVLSDGSSLNLSEFVTDTADAGASASVIVSTNSAGRTTTLTSGNNVKVTGSASDTQDDGDNSGTDTESFLLTTSVSRSKAAPHSTISSADVSSNAAMALAVPGFIITCVLGLFI